MTDFHRTNVTETSFIRGAARIMVAPMDQAFPKKIEDVIHLGAGTNEVQEVQVKGTKGTFILSFDGHETEPIKFNATAKEVEEALEKLSNIKAEDVAVTGGPGDKEGTKPYSVEFKGQYSGKDVSELEADATGLAEGETKTVTITTKTAGAEEKALYDAQGEWTDLGATKTGIQITINNAEESFDIDQVMGDIASAPTSWECSVGTQLAEFTPEKMQIAWEGSEITTDVTPESGSEKEIGFGQPVSYTQRRLAVLFQRPNGKIRGYFFHKVQRSPQESSITHSKTGEQISIPVRFKALADTTVSDIYKRFFIIRDQAIS